MILASRLRDTSLGDLLASLHRAYASGVLELVEPARRHAVHLRKGLVVAVESSERAHRFGDVALRAGLCARVVVERASRDARDAGLRIGQCLVGRGVMTVAARDRVLAAQRAVRLDGLYALVEADVRFHAARPLPPGSAEQIPMSPRETFHGRTRCRDHVRHREGAGASARRHALAVLGLDHRATLAEVRARYRERVASLHPDRDAGPREPGAAALRVEELRAVIEAWRVLSRSQSASS